jgi:hypothetical protein
MEMHFFCGEAVYFSFGNGNSVKDSRGFLFNPGGKRAAGNQLFNLPVIAAMFVFVLMFMGVRMSVVIVMLMLVVMVMLVRVLVIVMMFMLMFVTIVSVRVSMFHATGVGMLMRVFVGKMNIEFDTFDSGFLRPLRMQVKAFDTEFLKFMLQLVKIHAQVEQSSNQHIAADAAENIEVKGFAVAH